jgi:hypothetical protein
LRLQRRAQRRREQTCGRKDHAPHSLQYHTLRIHDYFYWRFINTLDYRGQNYKKKQYPQNKSRFIFPAPPTRTRTTASTSQKVLPNIYFLAPDSGQTILEVHLSAPNLGEIIPKSEKRASDSRHKIPTSEKRASDLGHISPHRA